MGITNQFARITPLSGPISGDNTTTTDAMLAKLQKAANNRFADTMSGMNKR